MHSFGLGAEHDGGYAEYGRFPADWVIPLPRGLTLFEASALGVAGHTAALAVDLMELNGLAPAQGQGAGQRRDRRRGEHRHRHPRERGYHVVAISGRAEQRDYLRSLGATEVLETATRCRFRRAAGEHAVGRGGGFGRRRADVLARAQHAARRGDRGVRQRGRREFAGNVLPFILRGVRLLGVNVNNPHATMQRIWGRLASDLKPRQLGRIARRIRFEDLEAAFDDLLAARVTGRQVVDFSLG